MIKKEIEILGKKVILAYCYATEISYKLLVEEELTPFMQEALTGLQGEQKTMPDVRKTIFAIIAAMTAYYECEGQDAPITDKELMYHATPDELGAAIGTLILAWAEFYKLLPGEKQQAEPKKRKKGKNS